MKLANKYYYSLFNSIDNILSEYEWRDFIYFFFDNVVHQPHKNNMYLPNAIQPNDKEFILFKVMSGT